MNEEKKVPFKWEYGEETISLQFLEKQNHGRELLIIVQS